MNVQQESAIELAPEALQEMLQTGEIELIDVREPREFEAGHIPGSRQVGFDQVTAQADQISMDTPLVLVCRSGNRSAMVAEAFRGAGYDAYHLTGGALAWVEAGRPLEPQDGEVVERSVADL